MRPTKKLTLKREVLAELTNAELAQVAGGGITTNSCAGVCPTSNTSPSCYTSCNTVASSPLFSCPTLNGCFEAN